MDLYKNIKITRYDVYDHIKKNLKDGTPNIDFDLIDGYNKMVQPYIYTDIKMTDYTKPLEHAFLSRLQIFLSSTLLRSILLKNGIVQSLNNNNFPSYYATLKCFMEVPAKMAYIVKKLRDGEDYTSMIETINSISLGMRTSENTIGVLPHTENKQINILTMFKSLDLILNHDDTYGTKSKPLTSFYEDICNFGHPNYAAYLPIGRLGKDDSIWRAKIENKGYKEELYGFYMPHFTTSIISIDMMCSMLTTHTKVSNFDNIESSHFFPIEKQE